MKAKLKAKDLIYAGAFAALYLILMVVLVTMMGVIPITYILRPLVVGIVCAPVYMLYISKVKKFGAILILGVLFGVVTMNHTIFSLVTAILFGIIAELICKSGNYESKQKMKMSFWIFNLNMIGPYLILVYAKPQYLAMTESFAGAEYAQAMDAITPSWIILVLAALAVIGGMIGTALSDKLMKKHFEKAGLV
ncbi:MAG: MptD family putative ECF transporter S component [Lachnospiraceae bacterium]